MYSTPGFGGIVRLRSRVPSPNPSRSPVLVQDQLHAVPIVLELRSPFADLYFFSCLAFAECALGRTFSIPFVCREQHRVMNSCMKKHSTPLELDAAREEWFAGRLERQREREKKTRRKLEQEKFVREWWNMPDMDPERVRREMEKLQLEERIGGQISKSRREASGRREGQVMGSGYFCFSTARLEREPAARIGSALGLSRPVGAV